MSSDATFRWGGLAAGALAGALALAACADFSRGEPSPAPDAGARPDGGDAAARRRRGAVVRDRRLPAARARPASRATRPASEAGDTQLLFTGDAAADYATVVMFVDTSAPAGSRLLSKMSGNGHQGGAVYAAGSPEYQTILQWIEQGAQP